MDRCTQKRLNRVDILRDARMVAKRAAVDAIAKPVFDAGVAHNWAPVALCQKTTAPNCERPET
jgi:hypothetical protein